MARTCFSPQSIALAIPIAGLLVTAQASALETAPIAGEPARVDVTESSSVLYNFDNRNSRLGNVPAQADDRWGMWFNRLVTNASWGSFQAGVRVDSAWFYTSRSPADISLSLLAAEHGGALPATYTADDARFFVNKYTEAGGELSTRAVNWLYPAKYNLSYVHPNLEVTIGDSYAQFGRGLVLNVRKQDELASDTTIRGARVTARARIESVRLKLSALGGSTNPLRIDEASGRFLGVTSGSTQGLLSVTEALMPRAIQNAFVATPRPNYIADQVLGAELEGRTQSFALGLTGAHLQRGCVPGAGQCTALASDPSRAARRIDNASIVLELPRLPQTGALYVEYAHQWRSDSSISGKAPRSGGALYASLNLNPKPVAITAEFRHYRSFYPLAANVDVAHAREFTPIQYSAPPTTEAVWNDTQFEHFNTCVTGGRVRADIELAPGISLLSWLGHYNTWGELASECSPSPATLNRVWDVAEGVETTNRERTRKLNVMLGARMDTSARPFTTATGLTSDAYYRELYVRYDFMQRLPSDLSVELRGWLRRRHQALGGPVDPWLQATTESGLNIGSAWSLVFGFEYDQNPAVPQTYFNGQVRYSLTSSSNLGLFVGQRQGGQRCVSGVCRVFPPFEGARLDATLRF